MHLFQKKDFISHSGKNLSWKINCDFLTDEDLDTLAFIISNKISFKDVIGVPSGGNRLSSALVPFISDEGYTLIVDDVLTTGYSMESIRMIYEVTPTIGVVIFARGKCPDWIHPIFQLNEMFQ
jgi:hypothetical protein